VENTYEVFNEEAEEICIINIRDVLNLSYKLGMKVTWKWRLHLVLSCIATR